MSMTFSQKKEVSKSFMINSTYVYNLGYAAWKYYSNYRKVEMDVQSQVLWLVLFF